MKIIHGLKEIKHPLNGSVVTVGVFDGVHIGHRKIIGHVASRAKSLGLKSVVVTFDPHPVKVLTPHIKVKVLNSPYRAPLKVPYRGGVPSLISLEHRIRLIENMGVDILVILHFTKAMARTSSLQFVKSILMDKLGMKEMYVGENFFFGRGAKAGPGALDKLSLKLKFKARALAPLKIGGKIVSSSLIRELIIKGDIDKASVLMGRPVSILGTIVHGAKRGRILGFPTANLNPHHEAIPPSAVYAVKARLGERTYNGVLNIGTRPTFHRYSHELEPTIEVHLFGINKDIYGRDMEVFFIKKLRDQLRFKTKEALIAQIKADVKKTRTILFTK